MITAYLGGSAALQAKLASITSSSTRIRIMRSLAKQVRLNAKKHAIAQTDLDGQPFTAHSRRRKRKMLTRLAQRLKVLDVTDSSATIGWGNAWESGIAYRQQFGERRTLTKNSFSQETGGSNAPRASTDPATRTQAKELLKAGYKIRLPNHGQKTPTMRWIMENLTIARAGVILRSLRGTKQSWTVTLPARSFLGVTQDEYQELTTLALDAIEQQLAKS